MTNREGVYLEGRRGGKELRVVEEEGKNINRIHYVKKTYFECKEKEKLEKNY